MRRLMLLLFIIILLLGLSVSAQAAVGASGCRVDAVLSTDGSCEVTLSVNILLTDTEGVGFPVPGNARGITINGSGASTRPSGEYLLVDLSRLKGSTVILRYTVPNTVAYTEQEKPQMTLALLCGFAYPMDGLDFTITLPQEAAKPHFYSGYHQQGLHNVDFQQNGNQITGSLHTTLKDQETLFVSVYLSEEIFPRSVVEPWSAGLEDTIAFVLMGLSFLYWLLFLRAAPFLRKRTSLAPDGCTAGELRCALTGQGADLTMMVFSWAQMGYLLIQLKRNGRVILHKRMEMGNERGNYELKVFRALFGKRQTVDSDGYHYAQLCRKVAASRGSFTEMFKKTSGNPLIFRALAAIAGVFGGASIAIGLAGDALLAVLIIFLLSILGGIGAWVMQDWVQGLHLRGRLQLVLGLGIAALWLALGGMAGEFGPAAGMVAFQLAVGLAWAYGGRRSPIGRQYTAQVLGFRSYLSRIPKEDMARILANEPDYFFTMAPFALALGVDGALARQFGRGPMAPCPWLITGDDSRLSALQWSREMRRAADNLDERQKHLFWERLMARRFV